MFVQVCFTSPSLIRAKSKSEMALYIFWLHLTILRGEKRFRALTTREVLVLAPFDIASPLFNSKKNCSVYKVHGTQNDRLGLGVSTQKSVLKNMERVPRYWPKRCKICRFGLATQILAHFG